MGNPDSSLNKAIAIAAGVHQNQRYFDDSPYILHPIRVMLQFDHAEKQTVAVLHDVIEKSDLTCETLRREGFEETVVAAVDFLSKRPGEDYPDYINRVLRNKTAVEIKVADIEDKFETAEKHGIALAADKKKRFREALKKLKGSIRYHE